MNLEEAKQLLAKYVSPDEGWDKHSLKVAEVAQYIAQALVRAGCAVDVDFVCVASILHDIGRYKTHHPSLHAWEGYRLLVELGYPRLASVCLTHVLKGRTVQEATQEGVFPSDFEPALVEADLGLMSLEEKIVALADILVLGTEVVSIEDRYQHSRQKYPDSKWLPENERRVKIIRKEIENILGYPVYRVIPNLGTNWPRQRGDKESE